MTEHRVPPPHSDSRDELDADLAALRRVSAQDLPPLHQVVRDLKHAHPRDSWLAGLAGLARGRRGLTVFAAAAAVAALLLLVPISYDRTVGHDAVLTVSGEGVGMEQIGSVARAMRAALESDRVQVAARQGEGPVQYELSTFLLLPGTGRARKSVDAFAAGLAERGFTVESRLTPRVERVSGNVYAFARDQVIRIEVKGKTASEVEDEIRRRLAEAGLPITEVSVEDRDGQREIRIRAEHDIEGAGDLDAHTLDDMPEIVITHDGSPVPDAETQDLGVMIKVRQSGSGDRTLEFLLRAGANDIRFEVPGTQDMTDAGLEQEIRARLRDHGVDAEVRVTDGRVQITGKDGH